jgi:peptidoglycan lytic transglycosylase
MSNSRLEAGAAVAGGCWFSNRRAKPIIAAMRAAAVVEAARRKFGRPRGALALGVVIAGCAMIAGCAARQPVYVPPPPSRPPIRTATGVASWYGPGFNGKPTASGEIYDESDLTAASNIFPLGSRVVVTDLDDGRAVKVRINDRGPFVKGRKIDLSYGAARVLGMVGPGTAPVRMDLVQTAAADPAGSPRYFVQVGAFAESANAEHLRARLAAYYSDVKIDELATGGTRYYRVRMGGFATRYQARQRAAQSARFGLPTIIVRE